MPGANVREPCCERDVNTSLGSPSVRSRWVSGRATMCPRLRDSRPPTKRVAAWASKGPRRRQIPGARKGRGNPPAPPWTVPVDTQADLCAKREAPANSANLRHDSNKRTDLRTNSVIADEPRRWRHSQRRHLRPFRLHCWALLLHLRPVRPCCREKLTSVTYQYSSRVSPIWHQCRPAVTTRQPPWL